MFILSNFHASAQIFLILSRGSLISIDGVSTVKPRKSRNFVDSLTNFSWFTCVAADVTVLLHAVFPVTGNPPEQINISLKWALSLTPSFSLEGESEIPSLRRVN